MAAKYVLAVLSMLFLVLAAGRALAGGPKGQVRTWLLIGVVFGAVSAYLFYQQGL